MLTLGSLFDGIGGFPLAARWVGIKTLWICEIDDYCRKLSKQNFPEIKTRYRDIRSIDEKNKPGYVDVISASPPCQPFSAAGKRRGVQDDRHLWPEALRVFELCQPRWVICENVYGLTNMVESSRLLEVGDPQGISIPQADGFGFYFTLEERLLIDSMLEELENIGYEPPRLADGTPVIFCVPAIGVGAFHIRKRIWIIAHADSGQRKEQRKHAGMGRLQQSDEKGSVSNTVRSGSKAGGKCAGRKAGNKPSCSSKANADTVRRGCSGPAHTGGVRGEVGVQRRETGLEYDRENAAPRIQWPTESPVCRAAHGIPRRVDRIKGNGNAIVPQIAAEIFRCIRAAEGLI